MSRFQQEVLQAEGASRKRRAPEVFSKLDPSLDRNLKLALELSLQDAAPPPTKAPPPAKRPQRVNLERPVEKNRETIPHAEKAKERVKLKEGSPRMGRQAKEASPRPGRPLNGAVLGPSAARPPKEGFARPTRPRSPGPSSSLRDDVDTGSHTPVPQGLRLGGADRKTVQPRPAPAPPPCREQASNLYRGVINVNGRWIARVLYRGQPRVIGSFDSDLEAAAAYDEMTARLEAAASKDRHEAQLQAAGSSGHTVACSADLNFGAQEASPVCRFGYGLIQTQGLLANVPEENPVEDLFIPSGSGNSELFWVDQIIRLQRR